LVKLIKIYKTWPNLSKFIRLDQTYQNLSDLAKLIKIYKTWPNLSKFIRLDQTYQNLK
jgi:exopolysaccharide biosynthesis predicted pyruvyltransferase EpsI